MGERGEFGAFAACVLFGCSSFGSELLDKLKASGTMDSSAFMADPISSDSFSCGGATVNGDPTTFAGAGSETNNGQLNTFTYGTAGNTPPKDDVSNVYAISHNTASAP